MKVRLKKPFRGPPIFYTLAIDGIDLVTNGISLILAPFGGVGFGLDAGCDVVQSLIAFFVFEDVSYAFLPGAVDLLLPPGLDLLPTFTAKLIYDEGQVTKQA